MVRVLLLMIRALPRPLAIPWRLISLAVYVGLNVGLLLYGVRLGPDNIDWSLWASLPELIERGDIYSPSDFPFVWSPVAAYLMAGVSLLGYWPWVALHVAVVFLLRDWRLIGLTLIAWPFWLDAALGNTMTFFMVAGVLALRGSRGWGVAYLVGCLLIPRPVQLPLALWLLWNRPDLRLPLIGLFAVHALVVLFSGYGAEWIATALSLGGGVSRATNAIGPSGWFGLGWLIAGIPLGVWLFLRGHVGWAGVTITPYLFPYYLLMPLVDLVAQQRSQDAALRRDVRLDCFPFRWCNRHRGTDQPGEAVEDGLLSGRQGRLEHRQPAIERGRATEVLGSHIGQVIHGSFPSLDAGHVVGEHIEGLRGVRPGRCV